MSHEITARPYLAAVLGLLCAAPAFVLNAIAGAGLEPLYSFFMVGGEGGFLGNPIGYLAFFAALALLLVGAWVALRPLLHVQRGAPLGWPVWLLNGAMALLLVGLFLLVTLAFGVELYRCDVLGVPNCD